MCDCKSDELRAMEQVSSLIDLHLMDDQKEDAKRARVVFIGSDNSGKHRVIKQLQFIMDGAPFSDEQLEEALLYLRNDCLTVMKDLVAQTERMGTGVEQVRTERRWWGVY